MSATDPKPGEHIISYAYASSPMAAKHKAPFGCYVIQVRPPVGPGWQAARDTYAAALEYATGIGNKPGRWSMDHPDNAHFLPGSA